MDTLPTEGETAARFEAAKKPLETRSAAGVTVRGFEHRGPTVYYEGGSQSMEYRGHIVETPDKSYVVFRGPLSGATFVKEFDNEGNEEGYFMLPGGSADAIDRIAERVDPNVMPEIFEAARHISETERTDLRERIKAAGGREKFLLGEAERLVAEGKCSTVEEARMAIIVETEIAPQSRQAGEALSRSAETGELPQDITDSAEAQAVRDEIAALAKQGDLAGVARLLPRLMRIADYEALARAQFALEVAKDAMANTPGEENVFPEVSELGLPAKKWGDLAPEDAQVLGRSEIEITSKTSGQRMPELESAMKCAWSAVAKLISDSGLKSEEPRPRAI